MTVVSVAPSFVVHRHAITIPAEARPQLGIRIAGPQRRYVLHCAADSNGRSVGLKEEDKIVNVNGTESGNVEQQLATCMSARTAFRVVVERSAILGKLFRSQFAEIRGTGTRLTARIWLPPDYTPDKKWPMIVFLHDMNVDHDEDGFLYFMMTGRPISEQAIVFAPLCPLSPKKFWWFKQEDHNGAPVPEMMDAVIESMEYMCSTYAVDRTSVHVTGSGMGGYATWELILQYPHLFRTAVPCGGHFDGTKDAKFRGGNLLQFVSDMDEGKVQKLVTGVKNHGIRIWIVHAPVDLRFPFSDAKYLFDRLKQDGCDVALNHTQFVGIPEAAIWLYVAQEDEKKTAGNMLNEFFFPGVGRKSKKRSKSKSRALSVDKPATSSEIPEPERKPTQNTEQDAPKPHTVASTRSRPPPMRAPMCPRIAEAPSPPGMKAPRPTTTAPRPPSRPPSFM